AAARGPQQRDRLARLHRKRQVLQDRATVVREADPVEPQHLARRFGTRGNGSDEVGLPAGALRFDIRHLRHPAAAASPTP
ncbi:MAG: hypothetical protein ACK5QX_05425, partial [bacterium]